MDRRELMRVIAIATGLSIAATGMSEAAARGQSDNKGSPPAADRADPQGFNKSGNPKASGGPDNPGVGNPHYQG